MKKNLESNSGFTLIEMLIVIGIIGILASLVIVGLGGARRSGQDAKKIADLRSVQNAVELYNLRKRAYPAGSGGASLNAALQAEGFNAAGLISNSDLYYWIDGGVYVIGVNLQEGIAEDISGDWPISAANTECDKAKVYCVTNDL